MARQKACDCCHSRKIHCDNAIPQCNWCKYHGLACTYDRVSKRVARSKSARRRLAQATNASTVASSAASSPHAPSDAAGDTTGPVRTATPASVATEICTPASSATIGEMHFAGYKMGKISSHCGIPLFSAHGREWIKSRTGEDVGSNILCLMEAPRAGRRVTPSMLSEFALSGANLDLPQRSVVDSCLKAFRASHFRLVFPIIDHVLYTRTIDAAYSQTSRHPGKDGTDDTPAALDPITAKASIFAFMAVLALTGVEFGELLPEIDGDACAFKAQHLLPFVLQETNVTVMQTMLMLTIYNLFTGQMDSAIKTHTVACRMLFMLGGHLAPTPPPSIHGQDGDGGFNADWHSKVHLRAVFWLCYIFDKDMSLRTGQPPSLEDEHCDLTFPDGYMEWVYTFEGFEELDKENGDFIGWGIRENTPRSARSPEAPWLPGDLRLCLIKSKVYRMLYSADALRKPDAELVRDIRELDEEVECWRLSVPTHMRPQLYYTETRPLEVDDSLSRPQLMHRTVMHFEYHYLLATIHRAVGRCRAWNANGRAGDLVKGLDSSVSISLEASRATISHLRLAINTLFEDSFWLIFSYPMSAILTIFGNIMMNPLHPRSCEDLQLLNLMPELFKQMQPRNWTPNELANMQMVQSFVNELIRLGSQAINKAKGGLQGRLQEAGVEQ